MMIKTSILCGSILGLIIAKSFLILNHTPSIPTGLYVVYPCAPSVSDIVVFDGPKAIRTLSEQRGYVLNGMPFLKPVRAAEGDVVCIKDTLVTINRERVAKALLHDSMGRPMPVLNLCHRLGAGEIFVLATDWKNSLDGRYYGVISGDDVRGCAKKIW